MNNPAIQAYKIIHSIWTLQIILLTALICLAPQKTNNTKLLLLTIAAVMLTISIGLLRQKNRMWLYSAIMLGGYWALYGWKALLNFAVNNYMFFTRDPLYVDSPLTIAVVYMNAFWGILPASILSFIMATKYLSILELYKKA